MKHFSIRTSASLMVVALGLTVTPVVSAENHYALGERAIDNGDYSAALEHFTAARKVCKGCEDYLKSQADALFFLGRYEEASRIYAKTLLESIDEDYDATKGKGYFAKALGVAGMLVGAYADTVSASNGIASNHFAQSMESTANVKIVEAVGDKDYRKVAKTAMDDLKILAKKSASGIIVVDPIYNRVAGAGLARVILNGGNVCTAVRVRAGAYAASAACLARNGEGSSMVVRLGSGLRPASEASVTSFERGPLEGAMTLTVASGEADVSANDWWPGLAASAQLGKAEEYAVTWYDANFGYLVPQFKSCGSQGLAGCSFIDDGVIWARTANTWKVAGFLPLEK